MSEPVTSRSMILFGTDEPPPPRRVVSAGRLSAELDRGNLRYIRWDGTEVLRAISFIVRDTSWGTYAPAISDLVVEETGNAFSVRYQAVCTGPEGDFEYRAEIAGDAAGRLVFSGHGTSRGGFRTNRTGFVVLHGLEGVVGREVAVEHASGPSSRGRFPERVDPNAPILDIRALTHEPCPGLAVSARMEGDAYEMEDQRNWTDASFKTFVRPLARGYPYRIEAGEALEQSVTLTIDDRRDAGVERRKVAPIVALGGPAGHVPEIGIALMPEDLPQIGLFDLAPTYLVARLDARQPIDRDGLAALAALSGERRIPVDLDIVLRGTSVEAELSRVAAALSAAGLTPRRVLALPERDLRSRASGTPAGEADGVEILAAARHAFPDCSLGGGTVIGFPEVNRNRPPPGIDFLAHSTQAIVHAADDVSVMETLEALAPVVATGRSFAPGAAYRLGPGTIGAPAAFYSTAPASNPKETRLPTAETDPRQRGLFAAAFALGYVATAARCGVDALTLATWRGPAGVGEGGADWPIAAVLRGLGAAAGRKRLDTGAANREFASLAFETGNGIELWIANLTGGGLDIAIDADRLRRLEILDADSLASTAGRSFRPASPPGRSLRLDAYAVARLRE